MPESQQNHENDFIIEKIKERPVNKKKLLRRTIITASMAVIFGLVACFTFLILEPVISNWLYPEEAPQIVVFPEDQEEMSPEEMLADNMQQESQINQGLENSEMQALEKEQLQEILAGLSLNLENYKQLYSSLAQYVNELKQSMVIVTGVSSDIDWFNNVQESKNQSSGVIIAENGKELLILADYSPLEEADHITITFSNDFQTEGVLKEKDPTTNLAVLSVDLNQLDADLLEKELKIATLGSSNMKNMTGMPVVALGRPMGSNGSLGYGIITSASTQIAASDANYRLLQTDIVGSQNAGGVLFNLQGQVIGIIINGKNSSDLKNMITAYGITDLKKRIEKLSNGEKTAYLGLRGVDVTKEANQDLNVPYGAYITEVIMDSPAMLAGIQQGDVLVELDNRTIMSFEEYTAALLQLKPGATIKLTVRRQAQQEYKEMHFTVILDEL